MIIPNIWKNTSHVPVTTNMFMAMAVMFAGLTDRAKPYSSAGCSSGAGGGGTTRPPGDRHEGPERPEKPGATQRETAEKGGIWWLNMVQR